MALTMDNFNRNVLEAFVKENYPKYDDFITFISTIVADRILSDEDEEHTVMDQKHNLSILDIAEYADNLIRKTTLLEDFLMEDFSDYLQIKKNEGLNSDF